MPTVPFTRQLCDLPAYRSGAAETPGDLLARVVNHASDHAVAVEPALLGRVVVREVEHRFLIGQPDKAFELRDAKFGCLRE